MENQPNPMTTTDPQDHAATDASPSQSLPPGWTISNIPEVTALEGFFSDGDWVESKDQNPAGNIRLLQLADIGDGFFVNKSNRFIDEEAFERLRCSEVKPGDVLLARMPDPLGRACVVPDLPQKLITVVDISVIRPNNKLADPIWLMYTLNSHQIRQEIELLSSGTTRKRISRGNLSVIEIPLPPLPEQKRVADKLDTLLGRIEAARERLERVPKLLKTFRQSVLSTAVSGELTREWRGGGDAEWEEVTLGEVIKVSSGKFLPAKAMADNGTIPVYGGNGINGYHNEPNIYAPTIAIGRVGFYCGSVNLTPSRAWITDNALIVSFSPEKFDIAYLYHLLTATDLRQNDSSTAQPVISGQKIYSISISIPPIPEQAEIVRRVEALFAIADRLEARYAAARAAFDRLTPALLQKAFRGELVPQDPNDEPASVLLERIRAQRAAAGVGAKRGRGAGKAKAGAGAEGAAPGRRGRPKKGLTEAEAVAALEARKAARETQFEAAPEGSRMPDLFGEG